MAREPLLFGDRVERTAEGDTGYIVGVVRDWSHSEHEVGWEHSVAAVPPASGFRVRLDGGGEVYAGLGELRALPVCGTCDP